MFKVLTRCVAAMTAATVLVTAVGLPVCIRSGDAAAPLSQLAGCRCSPQKKLSGTCCCSAEKAGGSCCRPAPTRTCCAARGGSKTAAAPEHQCQDDAAGARTAGCQCEPDGDMRIVVSAPPRVCTAAAPTPCQSPIVEQLNIASEVAETRFPAPEPPRPKSLLPG